MITAASEVEPRDRGVNAVLRQVEVEAAAAVAAASGNQAVPLRRDSGVILSPSLLLPLINTICQMRRPPARSIYRQVGAPVEKNKGLRLLSRFYLRHTVVSQGNVKQ